MAEGCAVRARAGWRMHEGRRGQPNAPSTRFARSGQARRPPCEWTLRCLSDGLAAFPDQSIDDVVMEVDAHVNTKGHGEPAAEGPRCETVQCHVDDRRD